MSKKLNSKYKSLARSININKKLFGNSVNGTLSKKKLNQIKSDDINISVYAVINSNNCKNEKSTGNYLDIVIDSDQRVNVADLNLGGFQVEFKKFGKNPIISSKNINKQNSVINDFVEIMDQKNVKNLKSDKVEESDFSIFLNPKLNHLMSFISLYDNPDHGLRTIGAFSMGSNLRTYYSQNKIKFDKFFDENVCMGDTFGEDLIYDYLPFTLARITNISGFYGDGKLKSVGTNELCISKVVFGDISGKNLNNIGYNFTGVCEPDNF